MDAAGLKVPEGARVIPDLALVAAVALKLLTDFERISLLAAVGAEAIYCITVNFKARSNYCNKYL